MSTVANFKFKPKQKKIKMSYSKQQITELRTKAAMEGQQGQEEYDRENRIVSMITNLTATVEVLFKQVEKQETEIQRLLRMAEELNQRLKNVERDYQPIQRVTPMPRIVF